MLRKDLRCLHLWALATCFGCRSSLSFGLLDWDEHCWGRLLILVQQIKRMLLRLQVYERCFGSLVEGIRKNHFCPKRPCETLGCLGTPWGIQGTQSIQGARRNKCACEKFPQDTARIHRTPRGYLVITRRCSEGIWKMHAE